jgi:hypothetical protein
MWCPDGKPLTLMAVMRTMIESFPCARIYGGCLGYGAHLLGSMQPMDQAAPLELSSRMPPSARRDLLEWNDNWKMPTPQDAFQTVVPRELPVAPLRTLSPRIAITDDQPFNEYYMLRNHRWYTP